MVCLCSFAMSLATFVLRLSTPDAIGDLIINLIMEKYRKYADPTTGINPYLPAYVNQKLTVAQKLYRAVTFEFVKLDGGTSTNIGQITLIFGCVGSDSLCE